MSRPIVMKPMNFALQVPFLSLNKVEQHPALAPYAYQALVQQTSYVDPLQGSYGGQTALNPPPVALRTQAESLSSQQLVQDKKRKLESSNSFDTDVGSAASEIELKRAKGLLRAKQAGWTEEEDEILKKGIVDFSFKLGEPDYERIIAKLPNRTIKQAKERWKNCLDPGIVKGEWSVAELCHLLEMIQKYDQQWTTIQRCMKSRSMHCIKSKGRKILGESLSKKLRRITKNPSLKKPWTSEEVTLLKRLHAEFEYDIEVISTKMAVAGFCRPEAQVERKILQVCECKSCKAECERYMKVDVNFKRAWTISKAALLEAKLLKQGKLA